MWSDCDNIEEGNWEERYLNAGQVDHSVVNKLIVENFLLSSDDLKYRARSARYIISNILHKYFPAALYKQKVQHQDGHQPPKYMKWQAPLEEIQCHFPQMMKYHLVSNSLKIYALFA